MLIIRCYKDSEFGKTTTQNYTKRLIDKERKGMMKDAWDIHITALASD